MANAKSPLVVMGSSPNLIYESFTENGAYEASDYGADGFASVIVNVPPTLFRQLVDKSITTVTAEDLAGVTTISNRAFENCSALNSVTFSNSVTSIGERAFYGSGLKNIIIPDSVTSLGTEAFRAIQWVSLSLGSGISTIPSWCFATNYYAEKLTIPDTVETLQGNSFAQLYNLQKMIIGSGILQLKNACFSASFAGIDTTCAIIKATTPPTLENTDDLTRAKAIYVFNPDVYKTYSTNWTYFSSRIFTLVATATDLDNIIATAFQTKACVADQDYTQLVYDGSGWYPFVRRTQDFALVDTSLYTTCYVLTISGGQETYTKYIYNGSSWVVA